MATLDTFFKAKDAKPPDTNPSLSQRQTLFGFFSRKEGNHGTLSAKGDKNSNGCNSAENMSSQHVTDNSKEDNKKKEKPKSVKRERSGDKAETEKSKKRKLNSLNDSIEDFDCESNKKTPRKKKPEKNSNEAAKESHSKLLNGHDNNNKTNDSSNSTAPDCKEDHINEISYEDFLNASAQLDLEAQDTASVSNKEDVCNKDKWGAEELNSVETETSAVPGEDKKLNSQKKAKSLMDVLKWNSRKEVSETEAATDAEEHSEMVQEEPTLPKPKNCKSITNFFTKTDKAKTFVTERSPSQIQTKAEVYQDPEVRESNVPIKKADKQTGSKLKSPKTNVVADDEDEIVLVGSYPVTPVKEKKKRCEARKQLESSFCERSEDSIQNQGDKVNQTEEILKPKEKIADEQNLNDELLLGKQNDFQIEKTEGDCVLENENQAVVESPAINVIDVDNIDVRKPMLNLKQAPTMKKKSTPVSKKAKSQQSVIGNQIQERKSISDELEKDGSTTEDKKPKTPSRKEQKLKEQEDKKIKERERKELDATKKVAMAEQMKSLDSIKVASNKNCQQATLSFGQAGMSVTKPVKPEPVVKVTRPRKVKQIIESDDEDDLIQVDEDAFHEVEKTAKRSSPRKAKPETTVKANHKANPKKKGASSAKITKSRGEPDPAERRATRLRSRSRVEDKPAEVSLETISSEEVTTEEDTGAEGEVYKATLMQPIKKGKKHTPLKIRFTRLSSDSEPPAATLKKEAKLTKAQQLLKKAKSKQKVSSKCKAVAPTKSKSSQSKEINKDKDKNIKKESSELRRSSRRSAQVASEAIAISLEEMTPHRKKSSDDTHVMEVSSEEEEIQPLLKISAKAHKKDVKKTPRKTPLKKTSPKKKNSPQKKSKVKLAPIFQRKSATGTPITISDTEDEKPPRELTEEEKETLRIRRAFLFSGVPKTLKKQPCGFDVTACKEHAPWPSVSHVQQVPSHCVLSTMRQDEPQPTDSRCDNLTKGADTQTSAISEESSTSSQCKGETVTPWNLPASVALPISFRKPLSTTGLTTHSADFSSLVESHLSKKKTYFKKAQVPAMSEGVIQTLLAELKTSNPSFPVHRVYKQMIKRQTGAETMPEGKETGLKVDSKKSEKPAAEPSPAPESKPNRLRRGKRRRQESTDSDAVVVEEKTASEPEADKAAKVEGTEGSVCQQWPDKYSPCHSSHLISNTKALKRLHSWLGEWKRRTDIELRRRIKAEILQARKAGKSKEEIKKKYADTWGADDDSDFDLGSEGSDLDSCDAQEDSLCNTMLLTGHYGVGKTAIVYALAQELGYKVFEVNASARRSGKQILAQLQEATQSHQVSKKNVDSLCTVSSTMGTLVKASPSKPDKKPPAAFANFFKKSEAGANDKLNKSGKLEKKESQKTKSKKDSSEDEKPEKKKNRKRKSLEELAATAASLMPTGDKGKKGLDLSSVSLILFEEADVVLEEDKGFWTGVATFLQTTKRPILLTARHPHILQDRLACRMEHIHIRPPAPSHLASYLQLVCLYEGLRTSYPDLHFLVRVLGADIRQCLLTLQYWAQSGACSTSLLDRVPIKYSKKYLKDSSSSVIHESSAETPLPAIEITQKASVAMLLENHLDSEDDFQELVIPRKRRKLCKAVIEDDSSEDLSQNSPAKLPPVDASRVLSVIPEEDSQSSGTMLSSQEPPAEKVDDLVEVEVTDITPAVHRLCVESVMGLTHFTNNTTLLKYLEDKSSNPVPLVAHFKTLDVDLLHANLPQLLPLPKAASTFSHLKLTAVPCTKPQRRRIRENCDLFDSDDDSGDGFVSLQKKEETEVKPEEEKTRLSAENSKTKAPGKYAHTTINALDSISSLYDTLSFSDSHLHHPHPFKEGKCSSVHNRQTWFRGTLNPGDLDHMSQYDEQDWWKHHFVNEMAAVMETLQLQQSQAALRTAVEDVKTEADDSSSAETIEGFTLPVDHLKQEIRLVQEPACQISSSQAAHKLLENISGQLPPTSWAQHAAIATDFTPALRAICKAEQLRAVAGKKRRFLHYLDPMIRGMKESALDTLCSTF